MPSNFSREKLAEGIYFSSVRDEKFTGNRLCVSLITPLDEKTVSQNAIVPFLLRLGCKSCPDLTALNRRLGLLYGAQLYGDVTKFSDRQILSVSIKGIDSPLALHGEDMVRELVALLCDIVLDTVVENEGFSPAGTELERQNLLDTIEAEINDKRSWAQIRCVSLMFGGGVRALRPCGTTEGAAALTPQSAYSAYTRLLKTARIEAMFVGSGDIAPAREAFSARLLPLERESFLESEHEIPAPAGEIRYATEEMDISQSKLVLGFRCNSETEKDKFALRMLSAIYGGTPFSKLFVNVRERLGLCYYCSARYERGNDILMVSSGVEHDKKDAALGEILRQLETIRAGEITDEELVNTKLLMDTSFASVGDSLSSIEGWYLGQIIQGGQNPPEYEHELMNSVSKEDVIAAARSIVLDTVYFLTSKNKPEVESK